MDARIAPVAGPLDASLNLASLQLMAELQGRSQLSPDAHVLTSGATQAEPVVTPPADLHTLTAALVLPAAVASRVAEPQAAAAVEPRNIDPALVQGAALPGEANKTAAAPPLVNAWVTALHAPEIRLGSWVRRPTPPAPRRKQPLRHTLDEGAEPADAGTVPLHDEQTPALLAEDAAAAFALLPAQVQAELACRRGVLLVAPPGPGQRGLQMFSLRRPGAAPAVQPGVRCWAVRGSVAAVGMGAADWHFWRVRRAGETAQRQLLAARPALRQPGAPELLLRVTATVLPAPLRPAGCAWLDMLEPQGLLRELGSQWTWLLGWSPQPLHFLRT